MPERTGSIKVASVCVCVCVHVFVSVDFWNQFITINPVVESGNLRCRKHHAKTRINTVLEDDYKDVPLS